MPKSIHERVRAQLERTARAEQRAKDRARDAAMRRLEKRDAAIDARLDEEDPAFETLRELADHEIADEIVRTRQYTRTG